MIKKNQYKVNRRGKFTRKSLINVADFKNKNYDRLMTLIRYIEYVNLLPRRKINSWIEKIRLAEKTNRKRSLRKIYFMFKRSKRELKKSFFLLKRIERKKRIRVKRNLLKKRICFVMFKKTNTNFFVTVIDIAGNVIMYSSAGMYCNFNNSKKKNSVFLVNLMMKGVVNKIRSLKIKRLRILLKSNVSKHVFQAVRYLNKFRFEIEHIALLKPIPHHNGQRKRKLKRL